MVECKKCKSKNTIKNGKVRKKQRYKCRSCGYNFVEGHAYYSREKTAKKAMVVILYALGKGSYNMLGKIFGVCRTTIQNWIVEAANTLDEEEIEDSINEIEFDEMWHYIGVKKTKCGLSRRLTAAERELLHGFLADVMKRPSADYMTK